MPIKILIAPLDWGLGHATRCIPVVRYLLAKGCSVTIAAEGQVATLLRSNFPSLRIVPLPGYRIIYSRGAGAFVVKILMQVPRILRSINKEQRWLQKLQSREHFDLVISDNRYGLKIPGTYSVIMTHQLQILTGSGNWADFILRKLHYRQLERFDACWVVDHVGADGLAGALSHPDQLPANAHYIGPLSQLEAKEEHSTPSDGDILILLSGPEPMRGIFEQKILHQVTALPHYQFTIIAGNPSGVLPAQLPEHVRYYTHTNARELGPLLAKASMVICRSGYSTIIDLAAMGKKALLVPTPGQSEQEYLAKSLHARQLVPYQHEADLNLEKGIAEALQWPGFSKAASNGDAMHAVVDRLLQKLGGIRN